MELSHIDSHRREDLTDAKIIGVAMQPGDEWFINGYDTYTWYHAIGKCKAPKRILELGVRYGYALIAMAKGAMAAGVEQPQVIGIDAEADGIESNEIAFKNIVYSICRNHGVGCHNRILKSDTKSFSGTNVIISEYAGYDPFDIVHVDGDHSIQGIQNELAIAARWVAANGWILVDDIDTPHVFKAALEFAVNNELSTLVVPTIHDMLLMETGTNDKTRN